MAKPRKCSSWKTKVAGPIRTYDELVKFSLGPLSEDYGPLCFPQPRLPVSTKLYSNHCCSTLNFSMKKHFYDPFYSVPLRELVHTGTLPLRFHKLVLTIGGEPESLNETKLFVTIKVSILILIFSDC